VVARRLAWLLCICAVMTGLGGGLALAHPEPGDMDGDNVVDVADNCPSVFNFDQSDSDGDRVGDRCDPDWDQDGDAVPNGYPTRVDNCPTVPNPGQADADGDGRGDACAIDSDGDTIFDFEDNCPGDANRFQSNNDVDDLGDVCDPDIDGDDPDTPLDLSNAFDNCPTVYNLDQRDDDKDGTGALCDADDVPRAGGSGPGSAGSSGSGASTPGTVADRVRPAVTVGLARVQRLQEIRGGLVVALRCSEACSLTARLMVDRRRARRLRLPSSGLVASGRAQVEAAASTYAFVRFTAAARRVLFRQRSVPATLHVEAVDRAGNRRVVRKPVTLRR